MKPGSLVAYFAGLFFVVGIQPVCQQYFSDTIYVSEKVLDPASIKFVGTNACVHCHKSGHAFHPHAVAGKEYSVWVNSDPHSRAYAMLFDQKSVDISRNLRLTAPPHKNDLCLNCHSTNVPSSQLAAGHQHSPADGVGCESCHGGAEQWIVPHKFPEWQLLSSGQKEALGFIDTDNLATRTRTCVECHVGSPGRDVNHDLIAAGHPRLYFEMSANQARMPRHWSRAEELQQQSETAEARLWRVGQFVSAAASLELLQQRADNLAAPWPEFGEYGCFSCHGDLVSQSNKNAAFVFKSARATPEWGTWHYSLLADLIPVTGLSDSAELTLELKQLQTAMANPIPDRDKVAELTFKIRNELDTIADQLADTSLPESVVNELAARIFGSEFEQGDVNWDSLTQRYLAAVALRQSIIDSRKSGGRSSNEDRDDSMRLLVEVRDALKFIENHDGPKQLDSAQMESIRRSFDSAFEKLNR